MQDPYSKEIRNTTINLMIIIGSEKLNFLIYHCDDIDDIANSLFGVDFTFLAKKSHYDKINITEVLEILAQNHIYPSDIRDSLERKKLNGDHARTKKQAQFYKYKERRKEPEPNKSPKSLLLNYSPDEVRELEASIMLDAKSRKMLKEFGQWRKILRDRIHSRNYLARYNETHKHFHDLVTLHEVDSFEKILEDLKDIWKNMISHNNQDQLFAHIESYCDQIKELSKQPKSINKEEMNKNDYQWAFAICIAIFALKNAIGASGVKSIIRSIIS